MLAPACSKRAPVETGVGAEDLALIEALLAGGGTDCVGRLPGIAARVIAADDIDRRQRTLQVFGELGGGEFHESEEERAA
jgi:hypothetical protein